MDDKELIRRIRNIIGRHLEDQASPSPLHKLKDVPLGIDGELADLIYIDKVANWPLATFLAALLTCRENRSDEEILQLLKDTALALSKINLDFKP